MEKKTKQDKGIKGMQLCVCVCTLVYVSDTTVAPIKEFLLENSLQSLNLSEM